MTKCSFAGCSRLLKEKLVNKANAAGKKPMCYPHRVFTDGRHRREYYQVLALQSKR